MEFFGDGVANLTVDERIGVDVMTTETTCLSSIWVTDEKVKEFYEIHKRPEDFAELTLPEVVYYDGLVEVDLAAIKPMIAMPFHPSNVYTIDELNANLYDILDEVEKKAFFASVNKKYAIDGSRISMEKRECDHIGCENYKYCCPSNIKNPDKFTIVKIVEDIKCPLDEKLTLVKIE